MLISRASRIIASTWTSSAFSKDRANQESLSGSKNDTGRLLDGDPFASFKQFPIEVIRRSFDVAEDDDLSREYFELCRFEEGVARTRASEEESSFALGLPGESAAVQG